MKIAAGAPEPSAPALPDRAPLYRAARGDASEAPVFSRFIAWPLAFVLLTMSILLLLALPIIWIGTVGRKLLRQRKK